MNDLLKTVVSLSLSGSLLILALMCVTPLMRNRTSKRWQYYIWLLVIARLLLPVAPENSPIGALFEDTRQSAGRTVPASSSDQFEPDALPAAGESSPLPAAWGVRSVKNVCRESPRLIWPAVALALLLRKITIYQDFVRYVRAGRTDVSDPVLLDRLARIGEQAGVRGPVELSVNPLVSSPLLLGFFRPRIVLPTVDLSDTDFKNAVLHELKHYKRGDMFYKWLVQCVICLHWFNPLVYLMGRQVNRACELSCDEAVLCHMDASERQSYGNTLIHAMEPGGGYHDSFASVTLTESGAHLKERLEAIMKFKNNSKAAAATALAVTILLAAGSAAAGAHAAPRLLKGGETSAGTGVSSSFPSSSSVPAMADVQISGGSIPDAARELDISIDIDSGGVEILQSPANELTAQFDDRFYDVKIKEKDGKWTVAAAGKVARMGQTHPVRLYLPAVKRRMNVHVLNGNFEYSLPENCADSIHVAAKNGGVRFTSGNRYENSAVDVTAEKKEYIMREDAVLCPDYFTSTGEAVAYKDGTRANQIQVLLTGYTTVEFMDEDPQ